MTEKEYKETIKKAYEEHLKVLEQQFIEYLKYLKQRDIESRINEDAINERRYKIAIVISIISAICITIAALVPCC